MKKLFVLGLVFLSFTSFAKNPILLMKTSAGDVEIELFEDKAPKTVGNFLKYVDKGFYKGTIFHRIIDGFMIQGGGFTKDMIQKPTEAPLHYEVTKLANEIGTLAMARTMDPHSATAQFFINVKDNSFLNFTSETPDGYGYAVFGKVTKGMPVVNKIKMAKTGTKNGMSDVPTEAIEILEIKRI